MEENQENHQSDGILQLNSQAKTAKLEKEEEQNQYLKGLKFSIVPCIHNFPKYLGIYITFSILVVRLNLKGILTML